MPKTCGMTLGAQAMQRPDHGSRSRSEAHEFRIWFGSQRGTVFRDENGEFWLAPLRGQVGNFLPGFEGARQVHPPDDSADNSTLLLQLDRLGTAYGLSFSQISNRLGR
jgi:hypothetical protein